MKLRVLPCFLWLCALLSSCTSPSTKNRISLQSAVTETVKVMKDAYEKTDHGKKTWGLAPSKVTISYNVSSEDDGSGTLKLAAPTSVASIGGEFGLTHKAISGNTVTLEFARK